MHVLAPVRPIIFIEWIFDGHNGEISSQALVQFSQLLARNDIAVILQISDREREALVRIMELERQ